MALRRSARALWAHWRAERRALRQGLLALVLGTAAGLLAGLTFAHLTDRLARVPGLLVLIPAAVGMRGTIFGAVGARLGTASAAGALEPTVRRGGGPHRNAEVAAITTVTSAVWLAVLATRVGLDPDDHSVPIVTSVMDISGIAAIVLAMTSLGVGVR